MRDGSNLSPAMLKFSDGGGMRVEQPRKLSLYSVYKVVIHSVTMF